MIKFFHACALIGLLLVTVPSMAGTISVPNGDFENPQAPTSPGYAVNGTLPNWSYSGSGGSGYYFQHFDSTLPSDPGVTSGTQYFGLNDNLSATQISVDSGAHWAPNTVYTLSIALGNRDASANVAGATGVFGLSTNSSVANFQGTPATVDTSTITRPGWATFTDTIVTGASVPSGDIFVIVEKLGASGDTRLQMDNLQLTSAVVVPEPASWLLAAMAALGMVAVVRRARNV